MADKRSPSRAGEARAGNGPATATAKGSPQDASKKDQLRPQDVKNRSSARVRKRKRRFDPTEKLPTPPPDPQEKSASEEASSPKRKSLEEDKENVLLGRPVRSASAMEFVSAFSGSEEAFQHLDKLHSLIDQIIELRAKNTRLFQRVRELERFKALGRLEASTRRTFLQGELALLPEEEVGFAESLLSAMLGQAPQQQQQPGPPPASPGQELGRVRSFRAPIGRQRSRSIGTEGPTSSSGAAKRSSCQLQYVAGGGGGLLPLSKSSKRNSLAGILPSPKVSKWTKVKAAFRWEKAGTGFGSVVSEALEHDAARFLRLPEHADVTTTTTTTTTPSGSSPRTVDHSGPPSPATISSSSSMDDVYNGLNTRSHLSRPTMRETEEDSARRSRSSDGELIIPHNIQYATMHSKDGVCRRLEKGHKTPWGMVKDIISSRRESVRRAVPPRGSLRSEDGYSLSSLESSDMLHEVLNSDYPSKPRVQITTSEGSLPTASAKASSPANSSEIVDLASRRLTPTLTITVPSSEELRSVSSPESVSPPTSHHQLDSTDERSPSEDPETSASSPKCRTPRGPLASTSSPAVSLRERRRSAGLSGALPRLQRQDSKWNKVKRAFLTGASSVPPSPSRISSFFDETDIGGSYSASAENLEHNNNSGASGAGSVNPQSEMQRNYQLLHDKLSVEFYRKLTEWERLKGCSNGQSSPEIRARPAVASSPKDRDSANALLMGEEQLTPEFKKKLDEWKRMKKASSPTTPVEQQQQHQQHQLFRRRLTDWQIWRTTPAKSEGKPDGDSAGKAHLSEDFLKKMEEWKKIKSARSDEEQSAGDRRDSEDSIYQSRPVDRRWRAMDEKEFQPLDKVIAMIEREQRILERHREKLLDKKSRISELSRVVGATPAKREVLVHTSTGFYRFEGISQEFTRKLYEWEKSQGIAPESSTFQLLNPAYRIFASDKSAELTREKVPRSFKRSKSMSSVVESSQRDETPLRQPSSLSLNDVTNLENEAKLRIDSKQTIGEEEMSEELAALDDSEPEAVIVDIEDVIEETASPMAKLQPQQTPVYCVTASETTSIAIPLGTVTASHEPSPVILVQAGESLHEIKQRRRFSLKGDEDMQYESGLENHLDSRQISSLIDPLDICDLSNDDNRKRLYDPSDIKICETIIEEDMPSSHIGEESNCSDAAEVSNDVKVPDNVKVESSSRTESHESTTIDQAALITEPEQGHDRENQSSTEIPPGTPNNARKHIFKTLVTPETEKIKKGGREELAETNGTKNDDTLRNRSFEVEVAHKDEVDNAVITVSSDIRQKKVLKTRRLTDTQVGYKWRQSSPKLEESSPEPADALTVSPFPETPTVEKIIINESTLNKIVVPTASNEQISNIGSTNDPKRLQIAGNNLADEEEAYCKRLTSKSESKSVFVKTKRIIFSPFSRRNSKEKSALPAPQKEEAEVPEASKEPAEPQAAPSLKPTANPPASVSQKFSQNIQRSRSSGECPSSCEKRPPLPQSPILSRKEYRRSSPKETAPSIRMMIQRYNQKLQEDAGSPASSGSGSPIWRSPTSERRVRTQMERYQEEVRRAIAGSPRYDDKRLEKSASAGIIQPRSAQPGARNVKGESGVLKSTSADFVRNPDFVKQESSDAMAECKNKPEVKEALPDLERRKSSLKNPEIFSNIKQSLVQEYKTLQIKSESAEEKEQSSGRSSAKSEENASAAKQTLSTNEDKEPGKISPELIHKLNALSNASSSKQHSRYKESQVRTGSENSTPLRVRAQRIKKAKDDFFSRGPSCYSHEPSIESYRHSQSSSTGIEIGGSEFVKSASAGMINVDTRTYERLAPGAKGTESLPRPEKSSLEVAGALSKFASKFRRAKLKRAKEKEAKMSTVSMLCRQSLLVDIQPDELSKSCPTSPSPQRDEEEHSRFKQHRDSN